MKEDIIRMAKEAGLGFLLQDNWAYHEQVECFFHMAQAAEREACAKVCGRFADEALVRGDEDAVMCFEQAEDAIRARGDKDESRRSEVA